MSELRSAIYTGKVTHRRRSPKTHAFSYGIYMMYLDLDEFPSLESFWFGVEKARPLSFRRRDYLGDPRTPLSSAVWERVEDEFGPQDRGAVRLLAHVRSFGYVFNPVTFYYCFDSNDVLAAVVAEITNTPWGERHAYVLRADRSGSRSSFDKTFHVSPFFGMNQRYRWRLSAPDEAISIVMDNIEDGERKFSAGLRLERQPMRAKHFIRTVTRHPAMGLTVHAAIYWQAFRLWLKATPLFDHPRFKETTDGKATSLAAGESRSLPPVVR